MEEKIIGYDVREMWFTSKDDFIKDGRFKKVLSIDASIWPSIFNTGDYPNITGKDREKLGLGTVELPSSLTVIGINKPLWDNLVNMGNYLKRHGDKSERLYWIVAITICQQDSEQKLKERNEWPYYSNTVPDNLNNDWMLVGYDVTSCISESVIAPCYDIDIKTKGLFELDKNINEYTLFSNIAKASEFKRIQDTISQSESPHLVYGIWRIQEILF